MTQKVFNCNTEHYSSHGYTISHQTYSGFKHKGAKITMSAADMSFWKHSLTDFTTNFGHSC
jgi:hypothetical protein